MPSKPKYTYRMSTGGKPPIVPVAPPPAEDLPELEPMTPPEDEPMTPPLPEDDMSIPMPPIGLMITGVPVEEFRSMFDEMRSFRHIERTGYISFSCNHKRKSGPKTKRTYHSTFGTKEDKVRFLANVVKAIKECAIEGVDATLSLRFSFDN